MNFYRNRGRLLAVVFANVFGFGFGCGETFVIKTVKVPDDAGACACDYTECMSNGSYCVQVTIAQSCTADQRLACITGASEFVGARG